MRRVFTGDCSKLIPLVPDHRAHTCVTSPPYYKLRKSPDGQLGTESTPQDYVRNLVKVFSLLKKTLVARGTLWVNIGDVYIRGQLEGLPWQFAGAMKADGWILRSDIIWTKPNALPESVKNRPSKSHEHLFLFALCYDYYYDIDATRQPAIKANYPKTNRTTIVRSGGGNEQHNQCGTHPRGKNLRDVWSIPTSSYRGYHQAVFPPELIRPCIIAGSPPQGLVLDPFAGSGTVGLVCKEEDRHFIGIELNPDYSAEARSRIS